MQFRRRVVRLATVGDGAGGRIHVVQHFGDRNRLRRRNSVHRDGVDVRHATLVAQAVFHHRRVGVFAVHGAGVRVRPVRTGDRGVTQERTVTVDRNHFTTPEPRRQRAREIQDRAVRMPAVRDHARHRGGILRYLGNPYVLHGTSGLQRQVVRRGNRARVARRVFHHRRVAVRGAVAQPAVRVRPARARHRGLAHLHAVAVDRNHFVRAKRRAQRTAQFGQGVVRGAAVGDHALHGPHVVVNRIDAHRL